MSRSSHYVCLYTAVIPSRQKPVAQHILVNSSLSLFAQLCFYYRIIVTSLFFCVFRCQKMITVSRIEHLTASVIWYVNYVYILLVAVYELGFYRDRFIKRNLLRPTYITYDGLPNFMSHRDKMDSEWELYRSVMPYLFVIMPISYLVLEFVVRHRAEKRYVLTAFSLAAIWFLVWTNGLIIFLVITTFFWGLAKLGSKPLIWISAFALTTISNWYAEVFMQFVSTELSRHNRYFVEFLGKVPKVLDYSDKPYLEL